MPYTPDYSDARAELEDGCAHQNFRGREPKHYVSELIASTDYTENEGGELTDKKAREEKKRLQQLFPDTVIRVDKYNGIDQGSEGACSFVSFLNLLNITKKQNILKRAVFNNWQEAWDSFDVPDAGAADIATTIDYMIMHNAFTKDPHNVLTYVPIRSAGRRELCFNKDLFDPDGPLAGVTTREILSRYEVSEGEYSECPWIYHAAKLIESLLDRGIPVEINAMEHSRTCIGYNNSSLIFADNWGMNWYETSNNPYNDNYSAGFSTIDKWAIYTWVRDLVYIDAGGGPKPRSRVALPKRRAAKRSPSPKRRAARRSPSPKRKPVAARRSPPPQKSIFEIGFGKLYNTAASAISEVGEKARASCKGGMCKPRQRVSKSKQKSGRTVHNPCQPDWNWNECRKHKCSYDKTLPAGQKCFS